MWERIGDASIADSKIPLLVSLNFERGRGLTDVRSIIVLRAFRTSVEAMFSSTV
jgi:hypothetical protein